MKKRPLLSLIMLILVALPLLVACAQPAPSPSPTPSPSPRPSPSPTPTPTPTPSPTPSLTGIKIGSASIGGDFYAFGDALAKVWGQVMDIPVENQPTGGSVENLRLIHNGEIDVALITARFGGYARKSTEMFSDDEPFTELRALAGVFTFSNISVVLKDSGITKLSDLAGKKTKFGVGPNPAVVDTISRPVYEAHGIDWENDLDRVYASYDDLYRQLGDGAIDMIVAEIGGLAAEPGYMELATNRDLLVVEYDVDAMRQAGLPVALIPAGSIPGAEKDTWAYMAGAAALITTNRVSEEDAYMMAKLLHENHADVAALSPNARESIANPAILTTDLPIVYHVGAARYWEEMGLWGQ